MAANLPTENPQTVLAPPFTLDTVTQKVRAAEDAWNSRDPDQHDRGLDRPVGTPNMVSV
jgi:hypothetical protein